MFINSRPPTFRISSPYGTPEVVEFTLSNASQNTLWDQILSYIGYLIRFIVIVFALFAIYLVFATRTIIPFIRSPASQPQFLTYLCSLLESLDTQTILSIATSMIQLSFFVCLGHTEEKLTVIRPLKMLVVENTRIRWWRQKEHSLTFIPLKSDGQFWLHELADRCVLAVAVENDDPVFGPARDELVVVFPTLLPDRRILEEVWGKARRCLYGSKRQRKFTIEDDDGEDDSGDDDNTRGE